jgi:hypothetical protein
VDQRVVRRAEKLSRLVAAESGFTRFFRAFVFQQVLKLPIVRRLMVRTVSGLDHKLPNFLPPARAGLELETAKAR